MKLRVFVVQLLLLWALCGRAQTITGLVTDTMKEPLVNASIRVLLGEQLMGGAVTDFDGRFAIKVLHGIYDVEAAYVGTVTKKSIHVPVIADSATEVNFVMHNDSLNPSALRACMVVYKKPLASKHNAGIATTQVTDLLSTTPGVYQSGANLYVIDGVAVQGSGGRTRESTLRIERKKRRNAAGESYKNVAENNFMMVKSNPLSTMSVDVDRASYSNVRSYISGGSLPPADAVRV